MRGIVDRSTRERLARRGWKSGGVGDFLDLTDAELAFIETKIALADALRALRTTRHLTQHQLARLLGSSQSRVAKMEAADATVSLDLLVRALLQLGAGRKEVARSVAGRE
jgi:predicted XRE-type DNA-binding protein